jgi:serine/threonine protein kinase
MHARGIVHRDLKPANVLVDGDTAKIADFGIASLRPDISPSGDDSTVSVGLTRTGAFMGTPMYMAPELIRGARDAQPSADVWSFGVMAHELLSGRLPFAEPPVLSLSQTPPAIDGSIAKWVGRCLDNDPAARPTAAELHGILSR